MFGENPVADLWRFTRAFATDQVARFAPRAYVRMTGHMYAHKGMPNRWRVDRYRRAAEAAGLRLDRLEVVETASSDEITEVRPRLAAPFRALSDEDLSWVSFWLVGRKRSELFDHEGH